MLRTYLRFAMIMLLAAGLLATGALWATAKTPNPSAAFQGQGGIARWSGEAGAVATTFGLGSEWVYALMESDFTYVKPDAAYTEAVWQFTTTVMQIGDQYPWFYENKNGRAVFVVTRGAHGKLVGARLLKQGATWSMSEPIVIEKL